MRKAALLVHVVVVGAADFFVEKAVRAAFFLAEKTEDLYKIAALADVARAETKYVRAASYTEHLSKRHAAELARADSLATVARQTAARTRLAVAKELDSNRTHWSTAK